MNRPSLERLFVLREAGDITRCHTMPTIKDQTVGHHTFNVVLILMDAVPELCTARLMKAAICHDLAEIRTGDIPAPVKWSHPELEDTLKQIEEEFYQDWDICVQLPKLEKVLLKCADGLELFLYCLDEVRMGNRNAVEVLFRIMNGIRERGVPPEMRSYVNEVFVQAGMELEEMGVQL